MLIQTQIAACDNQIEQCLSSFDGKAEVPLPPAGSAPRKPQDHQPAFNLQTHLHRISGVDFTKIYGMGALTVQTILSEVGLDPSRFPTVKYFTSWLGLCPGSYITGGKAKSSRTRLVVNRAANAFRMAAQAAGKNHSAIAAFHRRLRARLGAPKAITATAHKLAASLIDSGPQMGTITTQESTTTSNDIKSNLSNVSARRLKH